MPRASGDDALIARRSVTQLSRWATLAWHPLCLFTNVMNGAEGLTGSCSACGTTLDRALVREVRHFEETRLLEVTCGGCERRFLAIQVQPVPIDALKMEDVAEAAEQLAWARSLSDLFAPGDLDLPDAA